MKISLLFLLFFSLIIGVILSPDTGDNVEKEAEVTEAPNNVTTENPNKIIITGDQMRVHLELYRRSVVSRVNQADSVCHEKTGIDKNDIEAKRDNFKKITYAEQCYLTCLFSELGMLVNGRRGKFLRSQALFKGFPMEIIKISEKMSTRINSMITVCNKIVNTKRNLGQCGIGPAVFICFEKLYQKLDRTPVELTTTEEPEVTTIE